MAEVRELNPSELVHEYLRQKKKFPHVWCAGSGIGTAMAAVSAASWSPLSSGDQTQIVLRPARLQA